MRVILCCENSNGILFNKRRVSRDIVVTKRILEISKDSVLWMSDYSYSLFKDCNASNIRVSDGFLSEVSKEEYCFVEGDYLTSFEKAIKQIIVFRWNSDYPSDCKLDINLDNWNLESTEEFQGNSHECVTMEVYSK